jgi:adenine deaminase
MIKRPSMDGVLRNRIRAARGEIAPELVLKGGRGINVFTHEVRKTDVAIYDGVVVGTGSYGGGKCLDARGQYICPDFIDGHFHIESTMLSAPELPVWSKYL